jgi:hypothetical protein
MMSARAFHGLACKHTCAGSLRPGPFPPPVPPPCAARVREGFFARRTRAQRRGRLAAAAAAGRLTRECARSRPGRAPAARRAQSSAAAFPTGRGSTGRRGRRSSPSDGPSLLNRRLAGRSDVPPLVAGGSAAPSCASVRATCAENCPGPATQKGCLTARQELSRQRVGLASPDNSDTHDSNGGRGQHGRRGRCCRCGWRGRRGSGGGATSYTLARAASVEDREPAELQAT